MTTSNLTSHRNRGRRVFRGPSPLSCLLLLLTLTLGQISGMTEEPVAPIEVKLVSTQTGFEAGKKFTIGIHQKMKRGFHTYWKNPGTLGMPLQMDWKLPSGFKAGPIQWPAPIVTKMSVYNVWGFEDEALLLVDIQAPKNLKPGHAVRVEGVAIWMCCGDQCYPGRKELALQIPVVKNAQPVPHWKTLSNKTRQQQPAQSERWNISCTRKDEEYRLKIASTVAPIPGDVRFFGYDRQVSSDKAQRTIPGEKAITLVMQQEEHTGEKKDSLTGILVAKGEWEEGRPVLAVDVPVVESR